MEKVDKFMRGDSYGKADHYGRRPAGDMTPSGTPGSCSIIPPGGRQPILYRANSNESGKASYSSDKDMLSYTPSQFNGSGLVQTRD